MSGDKGVFASSESNLDRAKTKLISGGYTLVLTDGDIFITSCERGIKPLLSLLDGGKDYSRFVAADKAIGRAAAMAYRLLGVKQVYAAVVSEGAKAALERGNVSLSFQTLVPFIRNRTGDGVCPMEAATAGEDDPATALLLARKKLASIS